MKKLLTTTAIAGLVICGSANAQTTISGELRLTLKGIAADGTTGQSVRGIGNEQQINVQTKGKLNNGLDYAAGFSIENDGEQTGTIFNENVYMDFTSGNTTLSIGKDHIQRSDSDSVLAQTFGLSPYDTQAKSNSLSANGTTTLFAQSPGAKPGQSYGIAVLQNIPNIGKVSLNYVPNNGQDATSESEGLNDTSAESAYEIGFVGNLGVNGLTVKAFHNQEKMNDGNVQKAKANAYSLQYATGAASFGIARKDFNAASTSATSIDQTVTEYAVAYAINKDVTIGVNYGVAKKDGTALNEKAKSLQLGYNLGPVAMVAGVSQNDNIGGSSAAADDSKSAFLRFIGAF